MNNTKKDLVLEARQKIDKGFDDMERVAKNPSVLDRYLIVATYKSISFTDAIVTLCENNFTNESLPILRSLVEHSINMRWIMHKNSRQRLKIFLGDLSKSEFGAHWTDIKLNERMEEIGFSDRDYYDFCVKLTYAYSHVNASSLDWGKVYNLPQLKRGKWSPDAIYVVAAQMLGHVMKALNKNFEAHFTGYNDIWDQIKVDKNIRKKIEKVKEQFDDKSHKKNE